MAGPQFKKSGWMGQVPQLMKIQKVAELLDMSPHQVYELIRWGYLKAVRIGKRGVRVRQDSVEDYIKNNRIDPDEI